MKQLDLGASLLSSAAADTVVPPLEDSFASRTVDGAEGLIFRRNRRV